LECEAQRQSALPASRPLVLPDPLGLSRRDGQAPSTMTHTGLGDRVEEGWVLGCSRTGDGWND
jgi:hypothetical protein